MTEEKVDSILCRPPQVDFVPARYIFFVNVAAKMLGTRDNLDIWQTHFQCPLSFLHTAI